MTKAPKNRQDFLNDQLSGLRTLVNLTAPFSSKARKAKSDMAKIQAELDQLSQAQAIFTERHAPDGWALYDGMDTPTMLDLVNGDKEYGTYVLTSYHLKAGTLRTLRQRLLSERLRPWLNIYETARERAEAEDFVSTVPLILLLIDGIVTKLTGKHAFSGGTDAPVFDTAASGPGGVAGLLSLLGQQRGAVSSVSLQTPFRHGIMHGVDLDFGHAVVAAKAFNALHAVIDYCDRKADEEVRKAKALEEQRIPTIPETFQLVAQTAKTNKSIDAWCSRPLRVFEDGASQSEIDAFVVGSPEAAATKYLQFLHERNYGLLAAGTVGFLSQPMGQRAKDFRNRLADIETFQWHILQIEDKAAAVSEVQVHLWGTSQGRSWSHKGTLRLIYSNEDGKPAVYGAECGNWKAMTYFLDKLEPTVSLGTKSDERN